MINLAGNKDCDPIIMKELLEAGIPVFEGVIERRGEVPSSVIGMLGHTPFSEQDLVFIKTHPVKDAEFFNNHASFIFYRHWYYWGVKGFVPLHIANIIHQSPLNNGKVRVAGHCAAPEPKDWATRHKIAGYHCITSYHIDSPEGLKMFAEMVNLAGLI